MRRAALLGTLVSLCPIAANAGNGVKPRTPVLWEEPPCLTLVDRSVDANLHIPYAIPMEDPIPGESITPDEVEGSRTHQFFAFAREVDQITFYPSWINDVDVQAAVAKSIIEAGSVDAEEILDSAEAWAGEWSRITPDDPRRSISFDVADAGVDWDTTPLAVGVYHVEGYTFEPQFNLWWPRAGVIKVHDGDPDAAGPAIALDQIDLVMYRDGTATITGCIDAPAGTTVEGSWALALPATPLDWQPFGAATIDGDTFAVDFAAPQEAAGMFLTVRAVATNDGRSYTSHLRTLVTVLEYEDPEACDDSGGFIGKPGCGGVGTDDDSSSGGSGTSGTAPTDDTTSTSGPSETGGPSGCGCATDTPAGSPAAWWLFALGSTVLRRRSSCSVESTR
jgi:MYXO-CTERM domain-containing protein